MTVAARPSPLARAWAARWPIGAELALFLALMVLYEWLRDLVAVSDPVTPLGHALDVIDVERALGLFVEPDVQDWAHSVPGGEFVTTWLYTLAHTTGFAVMFLWMWFRRRRFYAVFRNWFWVTNGLAVIGYWLYPLAPPRLTDLGLEDPTKASLELGRDAVVVPAVPQRVRRDALDARRLHVPVRPHALLDAPRLPAGAGWRSCGRPRCCSWSWRRRTTGGSTAAGGVGCVLLALAVVNPLSRSLPQPWRAATA